MKQEMNMELSPPIKKSSQEIKGDESPNPSAPTIEEAPKRSPELNAAPSYDRDLHEHMARLGAGLQVLKQQGKAPLTDIISFADRVEFDFERVGYQIVRVPGVCADPHCPVGATMVGWPHPIETGGCSGRGVLEAARALLRLNTVMLDSAESEVDELKDRCKRLESRIAFMLKGLELAWARITWRSPKDAAAVVIQDALDTGRHTATETQDTNTRGSASGTAQQDREQ